MRHLSRTAVALAVGSAISMSAQADVLMTEWVENGNDKAIEIYNSGEQAADLSQYTLVQHNNQNSGSEPKSLKLTGELGAGQILVIAHSQLAAKLDSSINVQEYGLSFNGEKGDAVALELDGTTIDIIGYMGTDQKNFGDNASLQRNLDSLTPSATFELSNWTDAGKGNYDGLGSVEAIEPPPAFVCETEDGSEPTFTSINAIQGDGGKSPLIEDGFITEDEYFVRGVVTARGESLFKGFFLHALDADGNDSTSDGLFIYTGAAPSDDIQPGVEVCVKGKVQEFYNQTQLASSNNSYAVTEPNGTAPEPRLLVINEGETLRDALERYEGMLVELDTDTDLRVTRNFSYDYAGKRNNMVLSHKTPNIKPTQLFAAESDLANAESDKNSANRIFIESDYKAQSGELPYFADFNPEDGYIRIGDRVENLAGVIGYSYGEYRLVAANQLTKADFVRDDEVAHERTDAPALVEQAGIKVASFNVLNFFTSYSEIGGPLNASCADQADADKSRGCNRGAKDVTEFQLQRTKIVNAMKAMDADIIGIMEMENNGFGDGSAIKDLLDTLNSEFSDPSDYYAYVEISAEDAEKYAKEGADFEGQKYFGTDAIMVAMFYRPATVSLAGDAQVIVTPEQHGEASDGSNFDKYQRHSLLQGFNVPGQDEPLHIVVNHFKSKGSGCIEDVGAEDDLQGNCTEFRVSAAEVVGEAVSQLKGDVLVIGDLNSYGMEDPVLALTTIPEEREGKVKTAASTTLDGEEYDASGRVLAEGAGLINLSEPTAFSYTYEGELGSLDHVLGNTSVAGKVIDITDWHINSLESNMFEYGSAYTGDLVKSENAFSASDHDPVIVILGNNKGIADGVKVKPASEGESAILPVAVAKNDAGKYIAVTLNMTSASAGFKAAGDVNTVIHQVTEAEAESGSANVALPADLEAGNYQIKLELYKEDPSTVSGQVPADLGSAEISVEKADTSKTGPTPGEDNSSDDSSGGSFGFGALLALAGLGWTRRRRRA
ncbi:ExeM/NucH family extracellular endonuclease [Photobacterium sp. SDRW27]|uniref:ExeM/NucH family extracellular endonuclease n=1 Tax=Photobacterium obscurum TaxID=2829490 RepID=UPI002243962C|nr:ExeM/NucH family extracellular endonuclease [Photobacterium obscurum]MCW8329651.1 ExeM/NucH family extracellular endonuclease [Photobacterium obscurum]